MNKGFINFQIDKTDPLWVHTAGCKQNQNGETCGPSVRNIYLLHYIMKGKGIYRVRNQTYELQAGDVFAIYPDDIVFYKADDDDPWLFCWVGFGGTAAHLYYEKIGVRHEQPILHLYNNGFEKAAQSCIEYEERNKHSLSQLRLNAHLLEILSSFELAGMLEAKGKSAAVYVDTAVSYMEYYYGDKISAVDVSHYVNIEYSYFYRIFKSATGVSPSRYLAKIRIEKSKQLIQSGIPIKDIPMLVGIEDIYYFSKFFKKETEMTPTEYKNRCAVSEGAKL